MAKPQATRVTGDDCEVIVSGAKYRPHEGEWVELFPGLTVGEQQASARLRRLQVMLDAAKGEANEVERIHKLMDDYYENLCDALCVRIKAWNWTDDAGRPLPQPDGTAKVLKSLRAGEIYWLMSAVEGETPDERKNG